MHGSSAPDVKETKATASDKTEKRIDLITIPP